MKKKIILLIIFAVQFLLFAPICIILFIDYLPEKQTEFENVDKFWDLYPEDKLEIPDKFTNNATDIKYYAYNNKFMNTNIYGISMVLDEEDYDELKNSFTGDFTLSYYSEIFGANTKQIRRFNKLENFMISEQGKIGLIELIPDNIEEYEIFDYKICRTKDLFNDDTLSGKGILGNKKTGRIISFYNFEDSFEYDYYMELMYLENES